MQTFWHKLPKPFFVLAPMEAVTDVVFRKTIATAAAPDVWFTEFTNATGWAAAGDVAIGGRLVKTDDEQPIVAQLWGARPEAMAKLAKHCADLGYDGLDLNTGCPDSSAVKGGGGAALIRDPSLAAELIAALKSAGLPVSVKCRLGYSRTDEWHDWIGHLLSQDVDAITVHLRTKKEMSKVDAHWEIMPQIKQLRDEIAPNTILIGNGDVLDRQHGIKLVQETGIDGIMIGRGIFHNPFAFEPDPKIHTKRELLELLETQINLYERYQHLTNRPFNTLKRFFKIYVRDFDGASEMRQNLMLCESIDECKSIIHKS